MRHGLEAKQGRGVGHLTHRRPRPRAECRDLQSRTTASARTRERVRAVLAGDAASDSIGLGNVDARLRSVFGDDYGLVVETAPGAGTKVIVPGAQVRPRGPRRVAAASRRLGPCLQRRRTRGRSSSTTSVPALDELALPARPRRPRIGEVITATPRHRGAAGARRSRDVDVVFRDIQMPGLDGLDLAQVLARFSDRPQIVFVTAHDEHAVDAFELRATDYVMKPVRAERLAEAVRRWSPSAEASARDDRAPEDETDPRRARRRDPVRHSAPRSATSRPTATTRGCTPRPARTSSASRSPRSRSAGREPGSSASTARTLVVARPRRRRCARTRGRCRSCGRRRELAGQPPAHPRAARPACDRRPVSDARAHRAAAASGCGSPVAATRGRRPGARRRRPSEIDEQTGLGEVYLSRAAAGPAAAGARDPARASPWSSSGLPLLFVLVPGHPRRPASGRSRCPGWLLGVLVYPVRRPRRAGSTCARPSASSATSPTW